MHERGQGPNFASICNDDFGEKKLMLQQKPTHKLPPPLAACSAVTLWRIDIYKHHTDAHTLTHMHALVSTHVGPLHTAVHTRSDS